MVTQIDHIVLLVPDLDEAMRGGTTAGFTVSPGGQHDTGGTHNALIPFQDGSYIELLAFRESPPAGHYFAKRLAAGPGLADLALLSNDLDADLASLAVQGLPYPPPTELSRVRPDGVCITWRMSLPATTYPGKGYPFLIQDTSDRALRVSGETNHANGAIGIAGVSLVTMDINADASLIAVLLGVPEITSRFGLGGKGLAILPFAAARQWIALVQTMPDSAALAHFERFGAGPYAISLRTDPASIVQPWDGVAIDPGLVSGARILIA